MKLDLPGIPSPTNRPEDPGSLNADGCDEPDGAHTRYGPHHSVYLQVLN